MVKKAQPKADPVLREMKDVKSLLQALVVINAAQVGMTKHQARTTAKLASKTASEIWKKIKLTDNKSK
jgi:hypothetical protein